MLMNRSNWESFRMAKNPARLALLCSGLFLSHVFEAWGSQLTNVQTVFVIVMENKDWTAIHGNSDCPYINNTLLSVASHAEQYFSPPGLVKSEPNYLWLEAGTNFGINNDDLPAANHISTAKHLVTLLENAGISWRTYQESYNPGDNPGVDNRPYIAHHNPFVYFDDIANNPGRLAKHVRPYSELAGDLKRNNVARYNFITPNVTNDMHSLALDSNSKEKQGDNWLARELPAILSSPAYTNHGALFLTWDEDSNDNGRPIGMILLSPLAKGHGYSNSIRYSHSSLLRTVQTIFGVGPFLGDAANATDLADLFVTDSLVLSASLKFTNGLPWLTFNGLNADRTNVIQTSSNLLDWLSLSTNLSTVIAFGFADHTATNQRQRFYRALELR